jgi:UDP-glucuronate 4-epimerase
MTLLVTGAMGHVGYEIVRQAAQLGMPVIALYRGTFDEARAQAAGAGVQWLRCDLADAGAVRDLADAHRIDACIHAAAVSNEAYARPAPLLAVAGNVGATANLLESARTKSPILEDEVTAPANVYSTTKVCAEQLTRMYRTEYGLSASTVRISWVYGPPVISDQPTRGPIPSYLLRALRGEAIREGGAEFAASFTFVGDVAEGLLAAASAPELRFANYHLGPGVNLSVGQVAAAVQKAVPGAVFELGPGTEPWTRYTSIRGPLAGNKLQSDTGYAPTHSLDVGVRAYTEWMRANPAAWRA